MTSMTTTTPDVTGGVDTHGKTHHAGILDSLGRQLGDREFPTTPAGYRALLSWLRSHGELQRVGVEGTGTYGAALTRHLRVAGVPVVEVDRPDRKARRAKGKSDPLDAYSAARAALAGTASGVPKTRDGRVEAIRALRVARSSAVKARSQTTNQLKSLLVTGPAELREQLRALQPPEAPPEKHRHSGIGWHTPASVHFGTADAVHDARQVTLDGHRAAHPERFARRPTPPQIPDKSWINQPQPESQKNYQRWREPTACRSLPPSICPALQLGALFVLEPVLRHRNDL